MGAVEVGPAVMVVVEVEMVEGWWWMGHSKSMVVMEEEQSMDSCARIK